MCSIFAAHGGRQGSASKRPRYDSDPPEVVTESPDTVEVLDDALSDDERINGVDCPSDGESRPQQDADQDGEAADAAHDAAESDEDGVAAEASIASSVPSDAELKAAKQKVKAERKRKKMETENREWIDLVADEPLPDELTRPKSTAPEHGGPSVKVKCKPGDHPIEYFRA